MNNSIIIGKYSISTNVLMSFPPQVYVTNTETKETHTFYVTEMYKIIQDENLDGTEFFEYMDLIEGK